MTDERMSSNGSDPVDAIKEIFRQSSEPMTVLTIRASLPRLFGAIRLEELTEILQRQVAANVLVICPKYRSAQDRYWDRSLRDHAKVVLYAAMRMGPLSWSDLRKKFPKYLRHLVDAVLHEELAKGEVFRHPPLSVRMGPRYALDAAEVRPYASKELLESLQRLTLLGFARGDAREAMLRLLQEEEWAETPKLERAPAIAAMPAHSVNTPIYHP